MDGAQTCADAHLFGFDFVAADYHWFFASSSAPLRSQHTFTGAKKRPRRSCPSGNHAKNAGPLGASAGNRSGEESAGAARLLAKNLRALAAAPGIGQNQKFLH